MFRVCYSRKFKERNCVRFISGALYKNSHYPNATQSRSTVMKFRFTTLAKLEILAAYYRNASATRGLYLIIRCLNSNWIKKEKIPFISIRLELDLKRFYFIFDVSRDADIFIFTRLWIFVQIHIFEDII